MRTRGGPHRSSALPPWSSLGAILAGLLFAAWGYFHRDDAPPYLDAIASALSIIVPLLIAIGLAGLYLRRYGRRPTRVGFVLAFAGSGLGVLYHLAVTLGFADIAERYGYAEGQGWPPQILDWFPWLLLGITLIGIAYVRTVPLREWRFLPLSMGAFGWVYYFSDFGITIQMRTTHVLFGLLFSLSWVLLGYLLWSGRIEAPAKDLPA
jgi:hypothetical protein